ncbi:hypothetical protein D1872_264050 [compost metagenome]
MGFRRRLDPRGLLCTPPVSFERCEGRGPLRDLLSPLPAGHTLQQHTGGISVPFHICLWDFDSPQKNRQVEDGVLREGSPLV